MTQPEQWSVAEVAAYLGVYRSTVTAYRSRGQMPQPDGYVGRSPWWRPETIRAWRAKGGLLHMIRVTDPKQVTGDGLFEVRIRGGALMAGSWLGQPGAEIYVLSHEGPQPAFPDPFDRALPIPADIPSMRCNPPSPVRSAALVSADGATCATLLRVTPRDGRRDG